MLSGLDSQAGLDGRGQPHSPGPLLHLCFPSFSIDPC